MPIQIKFVKTADSTNVIQMKKGVNPPGDPFNKPVILDPLIIPPPPVVTGGSLSFPGTSSGYLTTANFAGLQLGTGAFTIEFFLFQTGSISFPRVFSMGSFADAPTAASIAVSIEAGTFYFWFLNGTTRTAASIGNVNLFNAWNHVAITRDASSNLRVFINGSQLGTTRTSFTFTLGDTTRPLTIGNEGTPSAGAGLSGRITNFRWVKGTAVYTANFTRPSAPLTAISGTELLLLVSSADTFLVDSSPNNRTVTNNGNNVTYNVSSPF